MSVAISQSRSSGLGAWLEAAASVPPRSSSPQVVGDEFFAKLHPEAQSAGAPSQAPVESGLARLFSTPLPPPAIPGLGLSPSRDGTPIAPSAEQSQQNGSPASLEGVFRNVPDEEIEPDNAILFWRRPADPPPVSWQSKLVLADAIRRAGYDPKDFAVSYWETKGEWPGGMMVIRELTLVAPDGRKIDMSADLVMLCPDAAVADVQRLMNWRPPALEEAVVT